MQICVSDIDKMQKNTVDTGPRLHKTITCFDDVLCIGLPLSKSRDFSVNI